MSQQPDIIFDQQETDLMFNRNLFPLKRQINQKLYTLFEQVKTHLKDTSIHHDFPFPAGTDIQTGKISQGENHNQFPWVMLDFPKLFQQQNIFAYRTLFWYGRGFSNSLVLGGACCDLFITQLLRNKLALANHEIYFSFAKDPWNHAVGDKDSAVIETIPDDRIKSMAENYNYIKLSNKYMLHDGNDVIRKTKKNYELFLSALL